MKSRLMNVGSKYRVRWKKYRGSIRKWNNRRI